MELRGVMSSMKTGGDIIAIPGSGKNLKLFTINILKHEAIIK